MKYENIVTGNFISRPNRFIAIAMIQGEFHNVHVKNTGRLGELLIPDAVIYLEDHEGRMGQRKLRYSLIAVEKDGKIINIDSQSPNKVATDALNTGRIHIPGMADLVEIKREKTFGDSRFDIYIKDKNGKEGFIEVKGCTLAENKVAKFPDAPTSRGLKHVNELIKASDMGYSATILFIIQMKGVNSFSPNRNTHPEFADALTIAEQHSVNILCYDCLVTSDSIEVSDLIPHSLR